MTEYTVRGTAADGGSSHMPNSNMPQKKSKKKAVIVIAVVILTYAALIFAVFWVFPRLVRAPGDNSYGDPYMETHRIGTSLQEAADKYGKDLLVDKIVLDNVAESVDEKYTLQFNRDDPEKRKNMERLSCQVYYGSTFPDTDRPYIYCNLCFNDHEWWAYKHFFEVYCTVLNTETINGVEVQYGEYSSTTNGVSYYEAQAFFTCNNIKYSVEGKTLELVSDTVKQMLS